MITFIPTLILIVACLLLGIGLYSFGAVAVELPTRRDIKANKILAKRQEKTKQSVSLLDSVTTNLAQYIPVSSYKINSLKEKLDVLHINVDAKFYIVKEMIRAFLIGATAIPVFFIVKIAAPIILILAVLVYLNSTKKLDKQIADKKEIIENELPRFTRVVAEDLKVTRDIIEIFEGYKKQAGNTLKNEINIAIADMRTGDLEIALLRLDKRISVPSFSNFIKGLLGVTRGDTGVTYFEILAEEEEVALENKLRMKIKTLPGKMKLWMGLLFGVALFQYIIVLAVFAVKTLNMAFSM
ncbi:MAG: hypothetical protein LBD41_06400 [Clostridiales Family XIII bacterium]|jgi:hypothetical protein|nr:hypothetical protein [Clostridiales Family XIII bacterium]